MTYGHLTVICGPMFGGKSTELLKRVLWAKNGQNRSVLVVKPRMDNRYSETKIVTHDGLSVDSYAVSTWDEVDHLVDDAEIIFFDEIQFFVPPYFAPEIRELVQNLLRGGKEVVVNGLDMDVFGSPFQATASLMAMADEVLKVQSACSICGRPATKTFKMTGSNDRVELGSVGLYEPRCNAHWS